MPALCRTCWQVDNILLDTKSGDIVSSAQEGEEEPGGCLAPANGTRSWKVQLIPAISSAG